MKKAIGLAVILLVALLVASGCTGFTNPEVEAGHEGYLISRPYYIGQGGYVTALKGPMRYGISWRKFVIQVDMRTRTYDEPFTGQLAVLAEDSLRIEFQAHLLAHIKEGGSREVVEKYMGENWYPQVVKEVFRNLVRNEIQKYKSLELKNNITKIGDDILDQISKRYRGGPFVFENVVVGNIQYPDVVTNAVSEKLAETQRLERSAIEIEVEKKKAERRVVEAQGIADSQRIINQTLTPLYLQHEAIQSQLQMANSPNHTTVYIPVGSNGVPMIYNMAPP